jgi:hypothetical protein
VHLYEQYDNQSADVLMQQAKQQFMATQHWLDNWYNTGLTQ